MSDFNADILSELESLFENEETETLVKMSEESSVFEPGKMFSSIKLVHKPTKTEEICEKYDTQIQNKAMALLKLVKKLKRV